MSDSGPSLPERETDNGAGALAAQLQRDNEALRAEGAALRASAAALTLELAAMQEDHEASRQSRIAALNLMEDAIEARAAVQRENAERKRAEDDLRTSEQKYRRLFEGIDEGFFIIEKVAARPGERVDFRYVEANPAFSVQSGVSDVVGRTMREVLPQESEDWYATLDHVLQSGDSIRREGQSPTTGRFLELYAFRLNGEIPPQVAVIFKDGSERKRAEDELRSADRRKDEFLATLAHELRNPLAPIRNSLEVLRMAPTDHRVIEHVYEMMERQINHMVRLVDDLMEVSRITRGAIELRREPVEMAQVVQAAVETCQPMIDAAGHKLAIDLPAEPLVVSGDAIRLAQVVANLLDNASKYTDNGGQIWLTVRPEDSCIAISVRDSGIGIPPEQLSNVFEMFTQVDRSSPRARGGLGIGLTLVRSLVEAHGGRVEAKSEGAGHGSEFIVRLPLVKAARDRSTGGSPRKPPTAIANQRILVVDDNRDAAESLGMLLKFLGAQVSVVHSGLDALKQVASHRPAVMLLDIGMPEMDGYEVARRTRSLPEGRDVTLIALTGWGQEEDRRRSKVAGFDHHLVKPVNIDSLHALLASTRKS